MDIMRKTIFTICCLAVLALWALDAAAQTCLPPIMQQAPRREPAPEPEKVPADRITIEQLKHKMDCGEKLLIIDSRAGNSWIGSAVKIKGAVHITTDDLAAKIQDLPRDREIVVYCT